MFDSLDLGDLDPAAPVTAGKPTSARRRSIWPAIVSPSMVLFGFVLIFSQVAGRRAGFTQYRYGWPVTYLDRDYREDATFAAAVGFAPGSTKNQIGWTWSDLEKGWSDTGLPLGLERLVTPWAVSGAASFRPLCLFADILATLLIFALAGWLVARIWQPSWRGRFRFRLRTMLLLVTAAAIPFGQYVWWRRAHDFDIRTRDALGASAPNSIIWAACKVSLLPPGSTLGWHPPGWLPECIAKLGFLAPQFERVDSLAVSDNGNPALGDLSSLPYLKQLVLRTDDIEGRPLAQISKVSSLECLDLILDRFSGDGIARLAAIPGLKSMTIDGFGVGDSAIAQLNNLKSLEYLGVERTRCTKIELHGLPCLRSLAILCLGAHIDQAEPLDQVSNLAADQQPADPFWHPALHVSDMPELQFTFIEGATLNPKDLQRLPALRTLYLTQTPVTKEAMEKLRKSMPGCEITY